MAARHIGTTITSRRPPTADGGAAASVLHAVFPRDLRHAFALGEAEAVMGREAGPGGLFLDHGTISRRHAALAWSARHQAHVVSDLGSRNGTSVDGVPAGEEPRALTDGSVLRLGDVLLVYESDAARPAFSADADADAEADAQSDAGAGARVSRDAVPGEAAGIRRLRALLARAAGDPAPALIVGETGSGKERVARELHRLSGRTGKLVTLNCAALSAPIVDSQLFGHIKGAFTGASDAQPGLFRAAHEGTLFLDEMGDLPPEIQPKLLRALQEGEVLPVGATQPVRVDVRVVAATHRDLPRAIAAGTFRQDLYARLSIWELRVPALRERRADLLDWIERLHAAWAARRGGAPPLRFDADAAEALLRAGWPLNLRGLERLVHELGAGPAAAKVIARAALPAWLAAGAGTGEAAATPPAPTPGASAPDPAPAPAGVPTREEFTRAFQELGGSVHALSRRFGRDRRQIYRWIEAHGLGDQRGKGKG